MKRFFTWFFYLSKRQLMSVFFIIILLIMPICSVLLKEVANSLEASITIGIIDENNTELSYKFIDALEKNTGIVSYVKYNNREHLEKDLLDKRIQCGYVIVNNFDIKLTSGDNKQLIEIVSTPDNTIALLSNEILFAKLFEEMGYYTLLEDIKDSNIFEGITDEDYKALKEEYDTFIDSGKTFRFNYSSTSGTYISSGNIDVLSYITTPIRGIVALFIFIGALSGGFTYLKDKKNGFKSYMCLYDITIPVIFVSISGIISITFSGITKSLVTETLTIIAYDAIIILFTFMLLRFINNSAIYCSTIPIFTIGSLVCSPIFINLATFFPFVRVIRIFFMPTHYYNIFNFLNGILT